MPAWPVLEKHIRRPPGGPGANAVASASPCDLSFFTACCCVGSMPGVRTADEYVRHAVARRQKVRGSGLNIGGVPRFHYALATARVGPGIRA
jgi:hypothetical protein